jgi:hypothetical protein
MTGNDPDNLARVRNRKAEAAHGGGHRKSLRVMAGAFAAVLVSAGCSSGIPEGSIVMTQCPAERAATNEPRDLLDQRYPPGSRVVLLSPPFSAVAVRVLSEGLLAAGNPVVCFTGERVFFAGKKSASDSWQIYESKLNGRRPIVRTSMPGGAMDPAIISSGDLVFSSPVPEAGKTWSTKTPAALYVQVQGEKPRQLTFGTAAAVEPTVLADGRVLFVSARPGGNPMESGAGLFTINNDGTEFTAFALAGQDSLHVRRPREIPGSRIAFLAAMEHGCDKSSVETVLMARPFKSRTSLFPFQTGGVFSVEPESSGTFLVCLDANGCAESPDASLYRIEPGCSVLPPPLFEDRNWRQIEAAQVEPRAKPVGRVSTVVPGKKTGTLLCLDANLTRHRAGNSSPQVKAERVRLVASAGEGTHASLGEVPLEPDGSFIVKVPADVPIGIETLDSQGEVLYRLPPMLWVRPGENRSCVGCHEPYNRSPSNKRPMAVNTAPVTLTITDP